MKTILTQPTLDGFIPSRIDWENNIAHYTTNFGIICVNLREWSLKDCCMGINKGIDQDHLQVKISHGQFQILREKGRTFSAVLESSKYKYPIRKMYPNSGFDDLSVNDVLNAMIACKNFSPASMIVKKELLRLMMENLRFGKESNKLVNELFSIWRKPIFHGNVVERKSIIVRKPIIITKENDENAV